MTNSVDRALEHFAENESEELVLSLLKLLAYPSQGGQGYRIELTELTMDWDHWDIDSDNLVIRLDRTGWTSRRTASELSDVLKDALEVGILKTREGFLSRIAWGTGKTLLGVAETAIGIVGIVVPEPGTTAAGVGVTILGVNTVADGVSQIFGANQGRGYNVLEEGSAWATSNAFDLLGGDAATGDRVGRIGFAVTSLAVGSVGAIRILRVPGVRASQWIAVGTPHSGRLGVAIPSLRTGGGGMTVFTINNNSGQSILRFVTQAGKLHVNGRIVGVSNVLRHERSWRKVCGGLLKLLWHGAKAGL